MDIIESLAWVLNHPGFVLLAAALLGMAFFVLEVLILWLHAKCAEKQVRASRAKQGGGPLVAKLVGGDSATPQGERNE
jgi:hypothetical protein